MAAPMTAALADSSAVKPKFMVCQGTAQTSEQDLPSRAPRRGRADDPRAAAWNIYLAWRRGWCPTTRPRNAACGSVPRMGRDIAALVAGLAVDDKAGLTAGRDAWSTQPIQAAGIPPVNMTDGPNGARGAAVLGAGEARSACVPCGSALGATWNPELIERVGGLLGEETRLRGARILLAPTVNLHRSPVAGRNFECFSEDPLLSGRIAAAYVRGVQSRGVAVTVKHLVGNEAETERYTMNSVIDR